jgi:hypothetical protein
MARLSTVNSPAPDPTAINLTRMIARLQRILISPDQGTESKLRSSSLERDKVGTVRHTPSLFCTTQTLLLLQNIEHARSLLLKLEQDAQNIKVQTRKQETQVELSKKREAIQRLSERLDELNEVSSFSFAYTQHTLIMSSWAQTKTKKMTPQKEKTCWAKTPLPKKPIPIPTLHISNLNPTLPLHSKPHLPLCSQPNLPLCNQRYTPHPTFLHHNYHPNQNPHFAPVPHAPNEQSSSRPLPVPLFPIHLKPFSHITVQNKNR